MPRLLAVLLAGALVLGCGTPALARVPARVPRIVSVRLAAGGTLLQESPVASPRLSANGSVSPGPAGENPPNPLGSGVGVVILLVLGGALLWLRRRALRR
jgi:hypothetical protein